jgi:hypothetical protein
MKRSGDLSAAVGALGFDHEIAIAELGVRLRKAK